MEVATSESAFFKALTTETKVFGTANLAARTGHPFDEMLADWMIAIARDDAAGNAPSRGMRLSARMFASPCRISTPAVVASLPRVMS